MVPGHPFFNLDSRLSPQEIPYISFKPFKPWLIFASIFSLAASLYLDASDKHRLFSPVFYMAYCSVWSVLVWANYREKFAIIGSSHWWHRTRFVMPQNVRILVRSAENVSPWCAEELGLERVETISDYNRGGLDRLQIQLVTRKIEKMKDVLGSRRIETRAIARDR